MGEAARRLAAGALVGLASAALAACGGSLDARRAETCRQVIPAIAPPDATVDILRVGPGSAADSVRVDYRLTGRPGDAAKARWAVCGFAADGALVSVTKEDGTLTGASVYLLKRYYLDRPEATVTAPARP